MYYTTHDLDYWFEVHGEGIPVVLLHGFTGSSTTWKHLVETRPDGIQFITIDLPGHGRTKGDKVKTMEACCDDLSGLFQELGIEKFFLLGYSMGGRTALTYATKYPETIAGLILESASPGLADDNERKKRIEKDELLANWLEVEGIQAFVDYWEGIPLFSTHKKLSRASQEEVRKERLSASAKGLANSLRGMGTGKQHSNWGKLEKLDFPVLLIVGALDHKFITINKKMFEKLPNADFQAVGNAGHSIHVEKPETYDKIVTAFIMSHSN